MNIANRNFIILITSMHRRVGEFYILTFIRSAK